MRLVFRGGATVILAMLAASFVSGVVGATSVYDSVVTPAYTFHVVDSVGNSHDVDMEEAVENAVEFQKDHCKAVYDKFMQMDYRVYVVERTSRYNPTSTAIAFASDEAPAETEWISDITNKDATAMWHNVVALPFWYNNGEVAAYNCADTTGSNSYTRVWYAGRADDGFILKYPYLTQGFEADYPTAYEGNSIPSSSIDGQISGNVQCANTSNIISAVHIDAQSGLSGNAKITDDGIGGKNYRYYLSEEGPYSLTVLCDGDFFYSPTVQSNFYNFYNWACAPTSPGQSPNLNVCAAS